MKVQRVIALLILVIPGIGGVYGWKLMRDALFHSIGEGGFAWLPFLAGLLLFLIGVAFVGGFIFFRDKKRKLVQPRFLDNLDDD